MELIYNLPIEAPIRVLHVDAYTAGAHQGFKGSTTYLVGCCGMCSFALLEPVTNVSASTCTSAIMKMQLHFGFCHTVVLDKGSKFFSVCHESLDLLKINCHVLLGNNHNPMLFEQLNRYLNKGFWIMMTECNSVHVALEALLLLIYAWNSCPIPGTDISWSLVAVGCKFAFPIDFSTNKHHELTSSLSHTIESYSKDLAEQLSACQELAKLLISEHHAWHRELVNS